MNELCEFLIKHMILDFEAEVDCETLHGFIAEDESDLAALVRKRLTADKLDDFLIVLSDVLREHIRTGIDANRVTEKISLFVTA